MPPNVVTPNRPMVRFLADGRIVLDTHDEGVREFLIACMYDDNRSEAFIRGLFGKSFNDGWVDQRREYLRRISDYSVPRSWTLARRTFGKTSLLLFETVRVLCLRLKGFILFTSNEQGLAEERTEAIRTILMTTPEIRDIFGYMKPQMVDGMKEVFGTCSWRLVDPVTNQPFAAVVPKSEGQTVNGLVLYVNGTMERPDLILNDDGEDRKTIDNEEIRKTHREWVTDVLSPCVDTNVQPDPETQRWPVKSPMTRTPWNFRFIDTYKHTDAYLPRLAEAPNDTSTGAQYWDGERYPIAKANPDGSFTSLVPELVSDRQVNALAREYESNGNPEGFWREYMCQRKPGGLNVFPASFQYYMDSDMNFTTRNDVDKFIICDPALTEDPTSAFSSMLAVAVDRHKGNIYFRRQITARMSPEDFDTNLFDLAEQTGTLWLLIEGLKGNNRLRDALIQAALKRGFPACVESLQTQTGASMDVDVGTGRLAAKRKRAIFAIRLYRPFLPTHPNGHVFHDISLKNSPMEAQMHSYPNCTFWDALDCVGHVDQAMRKLGIWFEQQFEEEEEKKQEASHMTMLGRRIERGDWRVC